MKTNKLKSYARKQELLMLTSHNGQQWLSAGVGLYPLTGWPRVNEEQLLTVLEVPTEKQEEYIVEVQQEGYSAYAIMMDNLRAGEEYNAKMGCTTISTVRDAVVPVYTPSGLKFVSCAALAPIREEAARGELVYRKVREIEVIVVMEGLLAVGVLVCLRGWIDVQTAKELCDVAAAAERLEAGMRAGEDNDDRQMRMEGLGDA